MSKVLKDCIGFVLLRSVIGPENSCHLLDQLEAKLKPITTHSRLVLWQFYDSQSKSTPLWKTDHHVHPRGSWFPTVYSSCILTDQYWQIIPPPFPIISVDDEQHRSTQRPYHCNVHYNLKHRFQVLATIKAFFCVWFLFPYAEFQKAGSLIPRYKGP